MTIFSLVNWILQTLMALAMMLIGGYNGNVGVVIIVVSLFNHLENITNSELIPLYGIRHIAEIGLAALGVFWIVAAAFAQYLITKNTAFIVVGIPLGATILVVAFVNGILVNRARERLAS